MALLLTVNRHTNKAYIRTRDFNFSLSGLTGFDLHGKTAGVVGTGKIGRMFAEICKRFGMRVLAYDKFPSPDNGLSYVLLPDLLAQADVISLHCLLTSETRHMIDAAAIAGMKPGVVIVNTSRGALIARRRSLTASSAAGSVLRVWTFTRKRATCSTRIVRTALLRTMCWCG